MTDPVEALARVIYAAHAKSRRIKSTYSDLGGSDRQHWRNVASTALSWMQEFEMEENESDGELPAAGSQW